MDKGTLVAKASKATALSGTYLAVIAASCFAGMVTIASLFRVINGMAVGIGFGAGGILAFLGLVSIGAPERHTFRMAIVGLTLFGVGAVVESFRLI